MWLAWLDEVMSGNFKAHLTDVTLGTLAGLVVAGTGFAIVGSDGDVGLPAPVLAGLFGAVCAIWGISVGRWLER